MGTGSSTAPVAKEKNWFNRLEKYTTLLSKWLYWIAGAGLIAMLVLVVSDIIGIKLLAHPIPGGIEITALLGVVVIGFAIAFVQVLHGHIQVDFIIMKLPTRIRLALETFTTILGLGFFAVLAWRTFDYARSLQITGEVSMTQKIPFYPFIYALAVCYVVTFMVLLVEISKSFIEVGKRWNQ